MFEPRRKCRQAHGIDDPFPGHPSLAGHLDSPVHKINFVGGMRVGIDAHHTAEFERAAVPPPIEVEPPRICVDLHGYAMPGTGLQDLFDVHLVSGAA